jgi:hypothetical protein
MTSRTRTDIFFLSVASAILEVGSHKGLIPLYVVGIDSLAYERFPCRAILKETGLAYRILRLE